MEAGRARMNKRPRDEGAIVLSSDDEEEHEVNPRQKTRPAGTTEHVRIHGVDLVLCQPPGRRGGHGEEFKPNLAWLAKAPDVDMTSDSSSAAGGGATLGQRPMDEEVEEDDVEELPAATGQTEMEDDDEESTQGPAEEGEEEMKDADKQQREEEEEEEVDMMEGVSSGENEEEGGEGLNEAEEKAGGSSSSSSSSSAVFKTAREAGTVGQAVLEAYKLIRRALRECNEQMKGEPGAAAADIWSSSKVAKTVELAVQSLLILLSPLYPAKASVEPPPPDKPEEGRAEIVALLRAIVMNGNETTKPTIKYVAEELERECRALNVHIPAIVRSALRPGSSYPSTSTSSSSSSSTALGLPIRPRAGGTADIKVEEVFANKLDSCMDLLERYTYEDNKKGRLHHYAQQHHNKCKKALDRVDEEQRDCRAKLDDHRQDEQSARKDLLDKDLDFKTRLSDRLQQQQQDLRTLLAGGGELDIISKLLDTTTASPELLQQRTAAAKLVEKRERQRVTAEQEEAIISAHADVVRKLVAGAQKLCSTEVAKAREELDHGQTQLASDLKQHVADAALKLQNVIEYHELRKLKADKNLKDKEQDIRQEKELFGNDAPTHMKEQERAVRELKDVMRHSEETITRAMDKNLEFYEKVDAQLPPSLARELSDLFHKNLACKSAFLTWWSQSSATQSNTQGGCSLLSQSVGSGNCHNNTHHTSQGGGGAMVLANPQHQQKQMRPQQGVPAVDPAAKDDKGCVIM